MKKTGKNKEWELVELRGHIIDSLTLSKVYDEVIARGGSYSSEEITIGRTKDDPSYARVRVEAQDRKTLDNILVRIGELGAVPVEVREVELKESPMDGVFPDGFYSTTNLDTELHLGGSWIEVQEIAMDCAVLVRDATARAIKMKDVKKGESIVVGLSGVRVSIPESSGPGSGSTDSGSSGKAFRFMSSGVSSEKPMASLIGGIAEELKALKEADRSNKVLFVCGPAIVHTGSRDFLTCLIEKGYVDVLFAGNALAVHDIEASIYGTSLGVSLKEGGYAPGGHNHHLRVINTIRGLGGIRQAVSKGVLTDGIMHACIKNNVDFLLAGSIRDDGPLPEVITDVLEAQTLMREKLRGVKMAVMISTMLHSIATGNLLPASVRTICVDIDHSTITKLADRGTRQATGLVIDAGTFLRELCARLP